MADRINNERLREDEQLEQWAQQAGAKRCTRCKFFVQKNQGCDHMTCRCGYEFCYRCGGKYRECECKYQSDFRRFSIDVNLARLFSVIRYEKVIDVAIIIILDKIHLLDSI